MTTMRVVGECFFWYRLTRVFPDKFHRAVKRLCVCVCVCAQLYANAVKLCKVWQASVSSSLHTQNKGAPPTANFLHCNRACFYPQTKVFRYEHCTADNRHVSCHFDRPLPAAGPPMDYTTPPKFLHLFLGCNLPDPPTKWYSLKMARPSQEKHGQDF